MSNNLLFSHANATLHAFHAHERVLNPSKRGTIISEAMEEITKFHQRKINEATYRISNDEYITMLLLMR